ncbi:hypothetical protein BFJ67_g15553 [Fusarium oxysporum f. sp. cepae]|nr:hypothetical protein BFJ67_g15553 [Fusarium oxysporum f. sp. cepae]
MIFEEANQFRSVHPTSRLNGWDGIKSRVGQLDLETTEE